VLTGEITETQNVPTDESPTFGVVNDGRKYPAVTARRRQQNGSPRQTLFTVSKNGAYKELYAQFEAEVIQPYFERQRERQGSRQHPDGNSVNTVDGGTGNEGDTQGQRKHGFGFPVNTVDG
jgi:hypothetical protein